MKSNYLSIIMLSMNYFDVSVSIDGTISFDPSIKPFKSLENISIQSTFNASDKEAILDSLKRRAISEIRFIDYLIDAFASLIFCCNYETTIQKIDRFYNKAINLPESKKTSCTLDERKESPEIKSQLLDTKDFDVPHGKIQPLFADSNEPMCRFKTEMQELNKPLSIIAVHLTTHSLKKYADPLEAIDSKHIKEIVDKRYLASEFLDRIEVLEILNNIKDRLADRANFSDLSKFLKAKIAQVERFHLEFCLNKLKTFDVSKSEEIKHFIYRNKTFLTKQVGNIELYNVVYQLYEKLKEKGDQKNYVVEDLISIANSIIKQHFSLLPADVWMNIFQHIDDSYRYAKYSNWIDMIVLSKRMRVMTQQHVNTCIYERNIYIQGSLKKPLKAIDAINYTVKNEVKSILLYHQDLSLDDLKKLLDGAPELTKIHINSLSDEMLPILYGFKKLKILSLKGNVTDLDLTNFEFLEELNLNYLNAYSIIFRENDQSLKKVKISGCDNTFAFERLFALESLEMDWCKPFSSLEIKSPVLKRLELKCVYCNRITIDKNIRSLKDVIIEKTSVDELVFPQELPQLENLEVFENPRLLHLSLPLNAPSLGSLIVKNNQLRTLQFPLNLERCKRAKLRIGEVQKVAFPDKMPSLELVEVESSKLERLTLPISAPNIGSIRVVSCNQLVYLTLPSNPKEGATLNLSLNPQLDMTTVADKNKYSESLFS